MVSSCRAGHTYEWPLQNVAFSERGLSELDAALLQYKHLTFSVTHTQYSKIVILSHASQSATSEPREMEILSYLCHHTDVM